MHAALSMYKAGCNLSSGHYQGDGKWRCVRCGRDIDGTVNGCRGYYERKQGEKDESSKISKRGRQG